MKIHRQFVFLVLAVLVAGSLCHTASAHCDTMDGPVVKDAQLALKKKDVTPVLKWVKKDAEPEIQSAFQTALSERVKNPQTEQEADKKFFETVIRVHRAGEGAAFEGLKPAGSVEPMIAAADEALETGSPDALISKISRDVSEGIKQRFDHALEARKHKDESVDAGREYVEAYIQYTHYIERLHQVAAGKGESHSHEESGEPL